MNKLIILSLLSFAACTEFEPGSLITETRVLGATVQVEGDPSRTTPRTGETANVAFVIEGVELKPVVRWSLAVCLPTASTQEPCPDATITSTRGSGATPTLAVQVPTDEALGTARSLHVSGVVCTRGEPDANRAGCVGDDADGTPLGFELPLAREADGSDVNRQPNLQQTSFRFDAKDWDEGTALAQGCVGQPELPQVEADEKEHRITIQLGPDARELVLSPGQGSAFEELQLSTFSSAGELERQFSFVSADDVRPRPTVEVKWTAPKTKRFETADQGVRFVVLVRDSRGGLARLERALCVVRPASGQVSATSVQRRADTR